MMQSTTEDDLILHRSSQSLLRPAPDKCLPSSPSCCCSRRRRPLPLPPLRFLPLSRPVAAVPAAGGFLTEGVASTTADDEEAAVFDLVGDLAVVVGVEVNNAVFFFRGETGAWHIDDVIALLLLGRQTDLARLGLDDVVEAAAAAAAATFLPFL